MFIIRVVAEFNHMIFRQQHIGRQCAMDLTIVVDCSRYTARWKRS